MAKAASKPEWAGTQTLIVKKKIPPLKNPDAYITCAEACKMLGVKMRVLRRYIQQGKIGSRKHGRRRLVVVADITKAIKINAGVSRQSWWKKNK